MIGVTYYKRDEVNFTSHGEDNFIDLDIFDCPVRKFKVFNDYNSFQDWIGNNSDNIILNDILFEEIEND